MSAGPAAPGRERTEPLSAEFFARPPELVAPELIGCELTVDGVGGIIVEAEAYAQDDPACHGFGGRTDRNAALFGPPGTAYVYVSYGIHQMLNLVTGRDGEAAAVLIRALEPRWGLEQIEERRGYRARTELCSGPGRLAQALAIGPVHNGAPLGREPFRIAKRPGSAPQVVAGPRIGITKAVELPWRFCAKGNQFVSRPRIS